MSEPGGPLAGPDVPRCGAIGTKCLSCPDHSAFLQALSCLTGEMEEAVIADSREILYGLSPALPSQGSPRCLLTTVPRSSNRCPERHRPCFPSPLDTWQSAVGMLLVYTTGGEIWGLDRTNPKLFHTKMAKVVSTPGSHPKVSWSFCLLQFPKC